MLFKIFWSLQYKEKFKMDAEGQTTIYTTFGEKKY